MKLFLSIYFDNSYNIYMIYCIIYIIDCIKYEIILNFLDNIKMSIN